jgi:hypothetical protein
MWVPVPHHIQVHAVCAYREFMSDAADVASATHGLVLHRLLQVGSVRAWARDYMRLVWHELTKPCKLSAMLSCDLIRMIVKQIDHVSPKE